MHAPAHVCPISWLGLGSLGVMSDPLERRIGGQSLVPKHFKHELSTVPKWCKMESRQVSCVWPKAEYGDLLSMFPGFALPSLGARVWMYVFLGLGQTSNLSRVWTWMLLYAPLHLTMAALHVHTTPTLV
eukprot:519295-Pelagomonas_calceolata.AAC.3